jgi:general secretion pathway protein B
MSFILEALKKSEQQKHQQLQSSSQQEVRNRMLSLSPGYSGRWRPYRKAVVIPLILISGWFLYSRMESAQAPFNQVNRVTLPPTPVNQAKAQVKAPEPLTASPQRPLAEAEPSPIPRETNPVSSSLPETPRANTAASHSIKNSAPTLEPPGDEAETPTEPLLTDEHDPAATIAQSEQKLGEAAPVEQQQTRLPLYLDLPKELRDRMPQMTMSMHYYSTSPGRSLVRINDRLLHEGDWLDKDLQLATITPTGATLAFLGKPFSLLSPNQ